MAVEAGFVEANPHNRSLIERIRLSKQTQWRRLLIWGATVAASSAAVGLLQRAGYPDNAMITMLRRMDKQLANARGLGFAKTHPSARSRIDGLRKTVKDTASTPDPDRQQRFSAALQSILASK